MEVFEIHITGKDDKILKFLEERNLKGISVGLLEPNGEMMRTEHMSSIQMKFQNYWKCYDWVDSMKWLMRDKEIDILRIKIECPAFYEHYIDESLYVESHWRLEKIEGSDPISINLKSNKLLATRRTYNQDEYPIFIKEEKGKEVELCLYDSFVEEDFDWFTLYNK
jgi:hypothetical protein